ncbi:MAG: hypothetical protein P4L46_15530 [Fimbriimonas sp.]|nr:hypothetical protein [Fimbriimonas sp.]
MTKAPAVDHPANLLDRVPPIHFAILPTSSLGSSAVGPISAPTASPHLAIQRIRPPNPRLNGLRAPPAR